MSPDYESPFLDREMPFRRTDDEGQVGESLESVYEKAFSDAESPFLNAESSQAMTEADGMDSEGSLFDPRELERLVSDGTDAQRPDDERDGTGVVFELDTEDESDAPAQSLEWADESEDAWTSASESGESEWSDGESPFRDGEIVELRSESYDGEVVEEYDILTVGEAQFEQQAAPTTLSMRVKERIRARVLWPALGFPAVVSPRSDAKGPPSMNTVSTRCLTVLMLSDRKVLSKEDAARYLRIVPWAKRSQRHIPVGATGSFKETDLVVRNDSAGPRLVVPSPSSASEQLITFGGDNSGNAGIIVNLSKVMRDMYARFGLAYLHEIRLSEEMTAALGEGQFQVFWNNHVAGEDVPSDEMQLLLEKVAEPRRRKELPTWEKSMPNLMREYEFEYGPQHLPYSSTRKTQRRADVLHPVFLWPKPRATLRIGHITDLHVDVRNDVYEHNLQRATLVQRPSFNNWNKSVSDIYAHAKQDAEILMLTGDLIDYGRGHIGLSGRDKLGADGLYHRDRNWFLLYDLLVAEERYTKPVYTSLGNHDWRINPYTPFAAAGAPGPNNFFNDADCFAEKGGGKLKALMRTMHGPGHEPSFSYNPKHEKLDLVDIVKAIGKIQRRIGTLDDPGLPTETTVDSVLWYLLTINPFFDYMWRMPSSHQLLMLDWAEDEAVLFPIVRQGKEFILKFTKSDLVESADPGPKAIKALTAAQKWITTQLIRSRGTNKIIGIHMPPIGPYPDWTDKELETGLKKYSNPGRARGPTNFGVKTGDTVTPLNGHPMYAVAPGSSAPAGMTADYGSFMQHRDWFVTELAKPAAGVRVVLSGHIHRNNLLVVRRPTASDGKLLAGKYQVRGVTKADVEGVKSPEISRRRGNGEVAPLYVNTTAAGPRGHLYASPDYTTHVPSGYAHVEVAADGSIEAVSFRQPAAFAPHSCSTDEKQRRLAAARG